MKPEYGLGAVPYNPPLPPPRCNHTLAALESVTYDLAMLALQCSHYALDPEFREVTDKALALTQHVLSQRLKGA